MQCEILNKGHLHQENGKLNETGWSRTFLLEYDRKRIRVPSFLIKEWDYYAVLNSKFGIAFTIADNGYLGIVSISVFDFMTPSEETKTIMTILPLGKFTMPGSSKRGNITFKDRNTFIEFVKEGEKRILKFSVNHFLEGKMLIGDIVLYQPEEMESVTVVTPFNKEGRFYYNQKINNMKASGLFSIEGIIYDFDKEKSYGVLDWGRGVWTFKNTWFWASASGEINEKPFGINFGYGFGNTEKATENALYYDGKVHKLNHVRFIIPEGDYLLEWRITSEDHRVELSFEPVLDRNSFTKILFLCSDQHQVFGYFSGKVVLDDGNVIILDRFFGFAEKVFNQW